MFAAVFMIQIACLTLHTTALPETTIRIVKIYIPILVWYFVEGQIELKMLEAFFLVIIWVKKNVRIQGVVLKNEKWHQRHNLWKTLHISEVKTFQSKIYVWLCFQTTCNRWFFKVQGQYRLTVMSTDLILFC